HSDYLRPTFGTCAGHALDLRLSFDHGHYLCLRRARRLGTALELIAAVVATTVTALRFVIENLRRVRDHESDAASIAADTLLSCVTATEALLRAEVQDLIRGLARVLSLAFNLVAELQLEVR